MKSLYQSHNMDDVYGAFIIRIARNETSERLAHRCAVSCDRVGQKYEFWDAYDGTVNPICPPKHHNSIMDLIKLKDHFLTRTEVACALSHISLWAKCVLLDQPIVILEHDAIMLKPYVKHPMYNSIGYLGGREQALRGWDVKSIPPYGSMGINYYFLLRAHAYAIDPIVAKNMLSYVIKMGIYSSLDCMLRADLFSIHQFGLFAYDLEDETTIKNRDENSDGRNSSLNNDLER